MEQPGIANLRDANLIRMIPVIAGKTGEPDRGERGPRMTPVLMADARAIFANGLVRPDRGLAD